MAPRKKLTKKHAQLNQKKKDFISILHRAKPGELESLLHFINKEGRQTLYNCVYNCLYNNDLPELKQLELADILEAHEKTLNYFCSNHNDEHKKKKLLVQKGGQFLAPILGAIIPLLSSWLFSGKKE
jgi:hypothetical protein